jgi:hypothetical protein
MKHVGAPLPQYAQSPLHQVPDLRVCCFTASQAENVPPLPEVRGGHDLSLEAYRQESARDLGLLAFLEFIHVRGFHARINEFPVIPLPIRKARWSDN